MSNMSEDIQYAGSDTRPPMLDRTDFESWQQRIRLYCLGKDNGENIMKSITEGPFKMGTFIQTPAKETEGALQPGPERARVLQNLSAGRKGRSKADILFNALVHAVSKQSSMSPQSLNEPSLANNFHWISVKVFNDKLIESLTNPLVILTQSVHKSIFLKQTSTQRALIITVRGFRGWKFKFVRVLCLLSNRIVLVVTGSMMMICYWYYHGDVSMEVSRVGYLEVLRIHDL
ncbi:hypothetical protein Tco_1031386 [Tanacetum coccineum]|uniref:Integrase, catalytic region, zinc finger, CCHC-type, peptidase aspartic, catalytic n=1 Tax=Tanacetum coccineum TaxID=301880 RepID=A0ABQ5G9C2_9ASTR